MRQNTGISCLLCHSRASDLTTQPSSLIASAPSPLHRHNTQYPSRQRRHTHNDHEPPRFPLDGIHAEEDDQSYEQSEGEQVKDLMSCEQPENTIRQRDLRTSSRRVKRTHDNLSPVRPLDSPRSILLTHSPPPSKPPPRPQPDSPPTPTT